MGNCIIEVSCTTFMIITTFLCCYVQTKLINKYFGKQFLIRYFSELQHIQSKMLTYMGIDLGTTSVKVCIVKDGTQVATISKSTNADIKSSLGSSGYEQDAAAILATTQSCMKELSQETLASVQKICITGQMHGVILWSSTKTNTFYNRDRNEFDITKLSPLYTWQDQRCTEEFLSSLPKPVSHLSLSTGHGNATLFWLSSFQPEFLSGYDRAGTVMDFLIFVLCGLDSPIMSTQLAASWGFFNCSAGCWNKEVQVICQLYEH